MKNAGNAGLRPRSVIVHHRNHVRYEPACDPLENTATAGQLAIGFFRSRFCRKKDTESLRAGRQIDVMLSRREKLPLNDMTPPGRGMF